jgi:hypothetical protein
MSFFCQLIYWDYHTKPTKNNFKYHNYINNYDDIYVQEWGKTRKGPRSIFIYRSLWGSIKFQFNVCTRMSKGFFLFYTKREYRYKLTKSTFDFPFSCNVVGIYIHVQK